MKKYITLLKTLLICLLLMLLPSISIKATSNTNISQWSFNGDIIQKYNFMVGDTPTNDDFIILGTLSDGNNIWDVCNLNIQVLPSKLDTIGNNIISIKFEIKDSQYCFTKEIEVKTVDFNSYMICNVDKQKIDIKDTVIYSDDGLDHIEYYKMLNIYMYNFYGKKINGYFNCSDNLYNPQIGYNDVTYEFIPSDDKFNTTYGKFTIFYDKTPTIKRYTDHIIINDLNREYYDIYVNGKKYKTTYINNLKSKTNYKIKIYQKATDTRKKTLLYALNVKTK